MNKAFLREHYSKLRAKLSAEDIDLHSQAIANQLIKLPIWNATYYSLFLTIVQKKEIDTAYILHILQGYDKEICVPKTFVEGGIKHYLLTDNTLLKLNKWGIPEPQNGLEVTEQMIEVVFIPLLAFDKKGNRIGYGKGFYDRFLNKCQKNIIKIGLSIFEAEDSIDTIETDVALDYCVTPLKVYKF